MSIGPLPLIHRHYRLLATVTLLLAAFNAVFNLHREYVAEWDESLYATSAWEMLQTHQWVATTFNGRLDYYNTKPPLFVWMIAATFRIFGPALWSLRLPSALSAWATVAILQWWTRRRLGEGPALFASLVLTTMFAFWSVHSGRSAATDAPYTLVVLLTAIASDNASRRGKRALWLGPLFAAAFMLRGMAVLLPVALAMLVLRQRPRPHLRLVAATLGLCTVPVALWIGARYRIDGYRFLAPLVTYDFFSRASMALEGHDTNVLFYLDVLQKYHYEWLIAAAGSLWLMQPWLRAVPAQALDPRLRTTLVAWCAVTLLVPTVMRTRVAWYLNPFYPWLALAVGLLFDRCLARWCDVPTRSRWAWVAVCVVAFGVAEGKLIYTTLARRSLPRSNQDLLFSERTLLRDQQVFVLENHRSARFVGRAITKADVRRAMSVGAFVSSSQPDDFLIVRGQCTDPGLTPVRATSTFSLCQRR